MEYREASVYSIQKKEQTLKYLNIYLNFWNNNWNDVLSVNDIFLLLYQMYTYKMTDVDIFKS